MTTEQCANCTRSASDGNLADVEDDDQANIANKNGENRDYNIHDVDKQAFFTLPRWRWMSSRRRSRRRIKEIKVDVPLNAKDETDEDCNIRTAQKDRKSDKQKEKHGNFFSRLFRRNSVVNEHSSQVKYEKLEGRNTSHISASNTDIRSHAVTNDTVEYHEHFKDKTPAVCGIKNHGNTCFMNAIVQCLSNTDVFAEYFVMDQYKIDFHRRNKIHAKKYGTKGEVTVQLAAMLKSLWYCQCAPEISQKFKNLVAKYGRQYEGTNQHDAQEFLLWLIDKVHEDLNTASKQKYKKPKNSYGRSDEDLAAETLANHLRCNNSFIHDLFQGQFRSSLSCPGCGRFSNTFDPYLCVSLPVPHRQIVSVIVNVVLLQESLKMVKLGMTIDSQATVKDFCEKLSAEFHIPKQRILLTEILDGKFQRTFRDYDPVSSLTGNEVIAIEMPKPKAMSDKEGEHLSLLIVNKTVEEEKKEMFWRPFVVQVPREATYKEIQQQILAAMTSILNEDLDLQEAEPLFQLCVMEDVPEENVLPHSVDHPLYMPVVDQVLALYEGLCGQDLQHLKLVAEWPKQLKQKVVVEKEFIEENENVTELKDMNKTVPNASLHECFDLYFTEEKLELEDAWMCPYCHRRLQGVKQLSLWTVPDVFIVHLKRFRQSMCQRTKVTTLVEFPLSGLDMSRYLAQRNHDMPPNMSHSAHNGAFALWSPWKRSSSRRFREDNVYDLYAVCNHHGSMQGGHYTAYCKNPVDGRWYLYDDTKVQLSQDSEVCTADAYILFYQRSSMVIHSCASSSTSGYSTASSASLMAADHWAFRMPPLFHQVPKTSKSQDNLCDVACPTPMDQKSKSLNRPFARSGRAYSSMIHFNDLKKIPSTEFSVIQRYSDGEVQQDDIPPPPPPPSRHCWTVTSV